MTDIWKRIVQKTYTNGSSAKRITELDFFRGIALLLMIYFHTIRSMNEIFGYQIPYASGINFLIGRISAIGFILISGIVFSLGKFSIKRFLLLAGMSIIITLTTYLYDSDYVIRFGILHFFALSSLIAPLFKKTDRYAVIAIGVCILLTGYLIKDITIHSDMLFMFGLVSKGFQSADYYPLIPRFGLYLIGMGIAKIFYEKRRNLFGKTFDIRPITFIGRHTLVIYLLHQPIIIAILSMIDKLFR